MNITIDNASPQIIYGSSTNGWTSDVSGDDRRSEYYQSTFHTTFTDGDYMQFDFNGTAIYVYGAYRENHGLYSTQLDGGNLGYSIGYASPDEFQFPIYVSRGLDPNQQHRITITNLPSQTTPPGSDTLRWYLDIDYLIVTTAQTEKVYTTIYDDFSPAFTYNLFDPYPDFGNQYYNNTNHLSYNVSASVTLPFNGSSVQLFGGVNYDHGNYSVVLDGGLNQVYNGTFSSLHQNTSLYLATNLTEGPHTVTITNIGASYGNALDFDYAVVNSTVSPNLGNNGTNATTESTTPNPGGSGTNTAAIAGGAAGGVVALLLLAFALWFFCFRKKRSHGRGKPYEPVDLAGGPITHDHSDGREVAPFPASTAALSSSPSITSRADTSRPMTQMDHGYLTSIPPPPSSNATSYPRSAAGGTSPTNDPYGTFALPPTTASTHNDESTVMPARTAAKVPGVTLPYTAARPLTPPRGPASQVEDRYSVHGREVDMGPAGLDDVHDEGLLPPDYHQATQPLPGQRPRDQL